jgi:hypothetical protein
LVGTGAAAVNTGRTCRRQESMLFPNRGFITGEGY